MIRKAFMMWVNGDAHGEYQRRHDELWPELREVLEHHGVRSYSIFLQPEMNFLLAYAEIDSLEQWDAIASTPECRRWWAHMRDIMPTNPDNSPVSADLREVFHMEAGPTQSLASASLVSN